VLFLLHRLARWLGPLRRWCLALALVGAVLAGLALGEARAMPSAALRLSLLFTLWMLLLYSFTQLFRRIPSPVLPALPWWDRARQRLHLWCYYALAFAVAVTGLILVGISLKLWLL
jgi:cytochrome b561